MEMKILLLLAVLSQDATVDQKIGRLIEQLRSDEASERDAAVRELTSIGAPALPRLEEAMKIDDLELRSRVKETIKGIGIAARVRDLARGPKTVTADLKDAPLETIVKAIEEQTGVQIDASSVPTGHKFTFEAKEASLLQSLDRLCAISDLLTIDSMPGGAYRLSVGKWLSVPTAYSGAFRLRFKSLMSVRMLTFDKHEANLRFTLEPDYEPFVKPLRNWTLQIDEIVDDQGKKLQKIENQNLRWQMANGPQTSAREFQYNSVSPKSTKLSLVRATATYSFPTDSQELLFDSPARGSSQDVGRFRVVVTNASTDSVANATNLQLTFSPIVGSVADLKAEIDSRFDAASVILVDAEGVEHPAVPADIDNNRFLMMQQEAKPPREIDYFFRVNKKLQKTERKTLKLQFHKETWQKTVTFEFKDVPLP
jgi:hypothetical protein